MSGQKLKLYQMNDYDWWADYSEDEARKNYIKWQEESCGIDREDIDVDDITEMSDESMEELKYKDEDMETAITFKEELLRNPKQGFFASTES